MIKTNLIQQKNFFHSGNTRPISFRVEQLKKLKHAILYHEDAIAQALKQDLGKHSYEAFIGETHLILKEITYALSHIHHWTRLQKVHTPLTHFPANSEIMPEPRGVVLIMSPWNYPFYLTFTPLVGAIASGNCAILKPSELAPQSSHTIAALIAAAFEKEYITVIEGDSHVAEQLTHEPFDYIFFTGSTRVGKLVMQAAAQNLTPVTLELGGKSPCIVTEDASLACAAKRIAWGKFFNAGQNCVAPDFVLVDTSKKLELINLLKMWITKLYGADPAQSAHYGRIINDAHVERLNALMKDGTILIGGQIDKKNHYIAPTILDNVNLLSPLMQEEIFGPLLPIISYNNLDEAIEFILKKPKPLAFYIFSTSSEIQHKLVHTIQSGGVSINDVVLQVTTPNLPFGGIGNSGFGSYHGKATFDTFTHYKSIFINSCRFDISLRYPPYSSFHERIKKMLRYFYCILLLTIGCLQAKEDQELKQFLMQELDWNPEQYATHARGQFVHSFNALKELSFTGNESVLDIGCGDGTITGVIAKKLVPEGTVIGIDKSATMIARAQKNHAQTNLTFAHYDVTNIPYENQFDIVISFWALQWIDNLEDALSHIAKCLKPGGRAIITHLVECEPLLLHAIRCTLAESAWLEYSTSYRSPIHVRSVEEIIGVIRATNFSLLSLKMEENQDTFESRIALERKLSAIPFVDHIPATVRPAFFKDVANLFCTQHPALSDGTFHDAGFALTVILKKNK